MLKKISTIFLFISLLHADTIILKDKSVIKGKILRVTEKDIEYDPEGEIPFDKIERKKVSKIIYKNGKEVLFSSTASSKTQQAENKLSPDTFAYVDATLGWNNATGLGVLADFKVFSFLTANLGVGISVWFYRFTAGIRIFPSYPGGFALAGGVYYSTGSLSRSLQFTNSSPAAGYFEVEFKPVTTAYGSLLYFLALPKKRRLFFEIGYAKNISKKPYYEVTRGVPEQGRLDIFDIIVPGGILLAGGISFPL